MEFTPEHDEFRRSVRGTLGQAILPEFDDWEREGRFPAHDLFRSLGAAGLLGLEYQSAYGGQGADHSFSVVFGEELGRLHAAGVTMAISVQTDMATPSLHRFGTHDLKMRYLVPALRGEMVAAIAVTEPDAGSDLAALRTAAVRDGDEWVVNGSKVFITNGAQADWVCLLARTSQESGAHGMSQILVPTNLPGFEVSRTFEKVGNRCSDTAELLFADLRVPVSNTIGEIGRGFQQQMAQFETERMIACYIAVGAIQEALDRTLRYVQSRTAFGGPLADKQYVAFRLAELGAEFDLFRHYTYSAADAKIRGEDVSFFATVAKLKAGRLIREVADTCLQLHGGLGYIEDNWTARFFRDQRLLSIGAGADEVMLRTIARHQRDTVH
jgi:citronellyl-CoA dehydrogenase